MIITEATPIYISCLPCPSLSLAFSLSLCLRWVGYEKEGFRGHQYLLEEGEYHDWRAWGGCNSELRSVRVIRTVSDNSAIHTHTHCLTHTHTHSVLLSKFDDLVH